MKKVLLIVRCNNKVLKKSNINLKNKRGSELAQVILITAIMITIISVLFFPQIKLLFENTMTYITEWFNGILGDISSV